VIREQEASPERMSREDEVRYGELEERDDLKANLGDETWKPKKKTRK
jgi:hypothetical protein